MEDAISALRQANEETVRQESIAILDKFFAGMVGIGPRKLQVILANEHTSLTELAKDPNWRVQQLAKRGLADVDIANKFVTALFADIWRLMSINSNQDRSFKVDPSQV